MMRQYKKHPWNSNQRYYVVEMCEKDESRKILYIHIPSALQGRQRNVIDLIKPNNIVQKCGEKGGTYALVYTVQ